MKNWTKREYTELVVEHLRDLGEGLPKEIKELEVQEL